MPTSRLPAVYILNNGSWRIHSCNEISAYNDNAATYEMELQLQLSTQEEKIRKTQKLTVQDLAL